MIVDSQIHLLSLESAPHKDLTLHTRDGSHPTGKRFLKSFGKAYGNGLVFPSSSKSARATFLIKALVKFVICVMPLRAWVLSQ